MVMINIGTILVKPMGYQGISRRDIALGAPGLLRLTFSTHSVN